MTLEEAKANIYRPVTAAHDGSRYNGKIQEVCEPDNLVRVNFGDGNREPSFWYSPDDLSFGWTGEHLAPPPVGLKYVMKEEPKYVGYNLNNPVLVKLDDKAFRIWKRHDDERCEFAPDELREKLTHPLEHYTSRANAEGYVEMQFNELMQIFGYYCRSGYEVFDMNVRLPKKKIEQL